MTSRPSLFRRMLAALASGLAVAAAVWASVTLLYFSAGQLGATPPSVALFAEIFLPSALVLFVLLAIVTAIRPRRRWYWTALLALALGILAVVLGTTISFLLQGGTLSGVSFLSILESLVGANLTFLVATVIAVLTVTLPVYDGVLAISSGSAAAVHGIALVRSPASSLADGEVTHIKRKPVDLELADRQWEAYVAALEAEGFTALEIESADEHPDSVFIEDTVVMLGQTAVITSPGAESRRGEPRAVEEALADLDLPVEHIRLPGTLDGGDVLKVGTTVYVGRGGRTNAEGIRQFRAIADHLGYTVVAVPVSKVLHLKTAVTALPDGTVLGHKSLVDPQFFERYLEVPEESGVAVIVLSGSAVLMASSAPKSAALIADLGYRVVTVDISEFEKLEGCVTCLSVRVR
jgi:dimethylargininase